MIDFNIPLINNRMLEVAGELFKENKKDMLNMEV